jgi:hypothetical protein
MLYRKARINQSRKSTAQAVCASLAFTTGPLRVGPKDGISYRYLTQLLQDDGYQHQLLTPALSSLPQKQGFQRYN